MIDQGSYPNKYVVDTNIIIYTLAGVKAAVWAMKKLEDDDIEVYYSTIVEADQMDLYSKRITGYSMQKYLTRELVIEALQMAITNRRPGRGLVIHSDRGSQYASYDYQQLLQQYGFICSMSRKGDCWDNCPMESFFKTLKTELVYHRRFKTRAEAKLEIFGVYRGFL